MRLPVLLLEEVDEHVPEPCIVIDNQDTSLHVYNHLMHPVYAKTVQKMARS